jgi:hypothetical protein
MNKPLVHPPPLEWEADIDPVTHPLVLMNFARLFGLTALAMGGLLFLVLAAAGEPHAVIPMMELSAAATAAVAVLCFVVALVLFRDRMRLHYRLNVRTAESIDPSLAEELGVVMEAMPLRPEFPGDDPLPDSGVYEGIAWSTVANVDFHPAWGGISLSNGWRTVMTLFCAPHNYDAVATSVREALAARSAGARRILLWLPRLLVRSALVMLACVPLLGLPFLGTRGGPPTLLTLLCVLAAVWFARRMAWGALGAMAWLAVLEALALGLVAVPGPGARSLSTEDQSILVLAIVGAVYLVALCVALLRGAVRSGFTRETFAPESE